MAKKRRYKKKKMDRLFRIMTVLIVILSVSLVGSVALTLLNRANQAVETPLENPLVVHDYDWANLTMNDNEVKYIDSRYSSKLGIDVSANNHEIDWGKVKKSGVEFAFIRCGYRGYTEGKMYEDSTFTYNIEQAIANGIPVGIYFFSQAVNVDEAKEEAEFTLSLIKDYEISLPVVYDIEKPGGGEGRVDNLSREVWTESAVTFLDIIEDAGYTPMIYNSTNLFEKYFNLEYLQKYDTWVAEYHVSNPHYPYQFSIWQYSSTGRVDGIEGDVDMDLMFVRK